MPRFYFDLHDDIDAHDDEGLELPDLESAVLHALGEARAIIQTSVAETGRIDLRHYIDVRDEGGEIVHSVHFEDAVTIQRGSEVLSQASAPVST